MAKYTSEQDKKLSETFHKSMAKLTEKATKSREGTTELFLGALQIEQDEKEKERAISIENEKARAIAEVEAKYDSQGIKSDHTLQLDKSYSNLLSSLKLDK